MELGRIVKVALSGLHEPKKLRQERRKFETIQRRATDTHQPQTALVDGKVVLIDDPGRNGATVDNS